VREKSRISLTKPRCRRHLQSQDRHRRPGCQYVCTNVRENAPCVEEGGSRGEIAFQKKDQNPEKGPLRCLGRIETTGKLSTEGRGGGEKVRNKRVSGLNFVELGTGRVKRKKRSWASTPDLDGSLLSGTVGGKKKKGKGREKDLCRGPSTKKKGKHSEQRHRSTFGGLKEGGEGDTD